MTPLLRISLTSRPDGVRVTLDGELAGPTVDELRACLQRLGPPVTIGLDGLTGADGAGCAALREAAARGARLAGGSLYLRNLVARGDSDA